MPAPNPVTVESRARRVAETSEALRKKSAEYDLALANLRFLRDQRAAAAMQAQEAMDMLISATAATDGDGE